MARPPWEITLREFIQIARRDYGIEIELVSAAIAVGWILRKGISAYPVPVIDPDELLPLDILRKLCRLYGIPPVDFGLDPDDDW
ncbi:MAG TPA: hypothetical protein VLQ45_04420 [Thermoanaerobaculia bacterium]|nr:hypothetical protein [Thermoanaerobaculia bacterium]